MVSLVPKLVATLTWEALLDLPLFNAIATGGGNMDLRPRPPRIGIGASNSDRRVPVSMAIPRYPTRPIRA